MVISERASTDDASERRRSRWLAALFATVAVLAAVDLASDVTAVSSLRHVLLEGSLCALGLGGFTWMAARIRTLSAAMRQLTGAAEELTRQLARSTEEAERWRQEAGDLIAGVGEAIDRQLERWNLSPAEKEVALLLLKGLSHKEIGQLRNVTESTVRQQGRALYQKAGLGGRHDLAAFFLEDLLDPHPRAR
jgi:DNA-binding NarL/FixJ family response regulator